MDKFTGGTSSKGAEIKISNDYQAAARAEQQRQRELQTRRDDLARQAERRLTEQRQTEARQAEERRQTEARQTAERHAAERRRQEQWQAEQQRQRETQQRASAGNGGNGGGGGHNTPPGSGGGGPPGGGPLRNFDPDIRNLADPRARVESYRTDPLNAQGREEFKKRNPDKEFIPYYRANDHLYRTATNPNPNPSLPVVQFHQEGKHSDWHASIREMERKAQLRFNASAYNDVGQAVKQYLDLAQVPTHSSIARLGSTPTKVDISYTVSGKQQAQISSEFMRYTETRPISQLFSWLKFKP